MITLIWIGIVLMNLRWIKVNTEIPGLAGWRRLHALSPNMVVLVMSSMLRTPLVWLTMVGLPVLVTFSCSTMTFLIRRVLTPLIPMVWRELQMAKISTVRSGVVPPLAELIGWLDLIQVVLQIVSRHV